MKNLLLSIVILASSLTFAGDAAVVYKNFTLDEGVQMYRSLSLLYTAIKAPPLAANEKKIADFLQLSMKKNPSASNLRKLHALIENDFLNLRLLRLALGKNILISDLISEAKSADVARAVADTAYDMRAKYQSLTTAYNARVAKWNKIAGLNLIPVKFPLDTK